MARPTVSTVQFTEVGQQSTLFRIPSSDGDNQIAAGPLFRTPFVSNVTDNCEHPIELWIDNECTQRRRKIGLP